MEESLDHFDRLRSLWGSSGEGWKLTALPVQASGSQPALRSWRSCILSAELAFRLFVGRVGGKSMAGTPGAEGDMGYGEPKPQRVSAWLRGLFGSSGHGGEPVTGSRAQRSKRCWNQTGGGIRCPGPPRCCVLGWVYSHKGKHIRGPLRWKVPGFLAVSPSQGWGRRPGRVTFCRETEKADTQRSGPVSGLHLIRSAFIGRKR